MRRNIVVIVGTIVFAISGTIFAGETEIILKDNTENSAFSVKDGNDDTLMRVQGDGKVSMGVNTTASGFRSTAMGSVTIASGNESTAMGVANTASGSASTAMGVETKASGLESTAMGAETKASGQASTAMGQATNASGVASTAMGQFTIASGFASTAMGSTTRAVSFAETVIGLFNTNYTPVNVVFFNSADRLFVIGNGTDDSNRSDAMVVLKNGNTGIGISDPQEKLHVLGNFIRVDGAGNEQVYLGGDGAGSDVQLGSLNASITNVALWNEATNTRMNLFVNNLTASGTISEGSSMVFKKNISHISNKEAINTLNGLNPVKFKYKADNSDEEHLGFIAEDVPELVAVQDRKHLRTMDITAVLTKVVKEQQRIVQEQQKMLKKQQETISLLIDKVNKIEGRI